MGTDDETLIRIIVARRYVSVWLLVVLLLRCM